jgi:hypothetical protein
MRRGKIGAGQTAIVQRGSNEDSPHARLLQPLEIGGAAKATRGIKHDIRRAPFNIRETIHVWSRIAADARQRHDDHTRGPQMRRTAKLIWPEKAVATIVER